MNSFTSSPSLGLRLPPLEVFSLTVKPGTITPDLQPLPLNDAPLSLIHPFKINYELFMISIQLKYVCTFVAAYITMVFFMNRLNSARNYKPWAFSKTSTFKAAVFVHNFLLAIFSAWVILSELFLISSHWLSRKQYQSEKDFAHFAEFLCQRDSSSYQLLTSSTSLAEAGCFYWGWLFYMSKFYEVVDTMIILAKGKRCSTLQLYHHSGVILLGWAALFYQSLASILGGINAMVHTFMYTYFAIQTLGFSIPPILKRLLTSIQITQFIVGMILSNMVLFIGYRPPRDMTTMARSELSQGRPAPDYGNHSVKGEDLFHPELTRDELIPCMSESGEGVSILFGTIYLLPLTYLFVQFFIRSYIRVNVKVKRN